MKTGHAHARLVKGPVSAVGITVVIAAIDAVGTPGRIWPSSTDVSSLSQQIFATDFLGLTTSPRYQHDNMEHINA